MSHEALGRLLLRRLEESPQNRGEPLSVAELHRVLIPYHECRDELGLATKAEYDLALLRLLRSGEVVAVQEEALAKAVERELESPEPGLAFLRNFAAAQLLVRPEVAVAGAAGEAPGRASVPDAEAGGVSGRKVSVPGAEAGRAEAGGAEARRGAAPSEDWLEALDPRPAGAPEAGTGGSRVPPAPPARAGEERAAEPGRGEGAAGAGRRQPGARGPRPEAGGTGPQAGATGPRSEAGGAGPEAASLAERCRECGSGLPERAGLRFCPFCGTDQTVRPCRACGEKLELAWSFCPRCGREAAS